MDRNIEVSKERWEVQKYMKKGRDSDMDESSIHLKSSHKDLSSVTLETELIL